LSDTTTFVTVVVLDVALRKTRGRRECSVAPAIETPKNEKARKPSGSHALSDSRGGTRTRDPGIMSAVL
jgi:hypothetical protein